MKLSSFFLEKERSSMRVKEVFESLRKIAVVWKRGETKRKPNIHSFTCACRQERNGIFCMQVDFTYEEKKWVCVKIPGQPFCSAGTWSKKKTNYSAEDLVTCMGSLGKYADIESKAVRKICMEYCVGIDPNWNLPIISM